MVISRVIFGAFAAVCATNAVAQIPLAATAPQPVVAVQAAPMVVGQTPANANVLPAGTNIRLRTLTGLSSKDNKAGQQFDLEVAQDVMLNGIVVIPRGSPATGEVSMVKKKGMWGKSGKMETRVLSVRANGKDIPVHGTVSDKGDAGTAGVVASIVVLPIAGFFVTGTSAVLPAGTAATAQLDSDLPVVFAVGAAKPAADMVVPAAAAVAASQLPK
jgi:hypothetical protein